MCLHACNDINDRQFLVHDYLCCTDDPYEFDDLPIPRFFDLFKEHLPRYLEVIQPADIASATTHLIRYLCTERPSDKQVFLRFQRKSSRRLRPWFWKVRTSWQRFQAEREMWRMVTVRRRFRRAAAPYTPDKMPSMEYFAFWDFGLDSHYYDFWKLTPPTAKIQEITKEYKQVWKIPYYVAANTNLVDDVQKCSPLEDFLHANLNIRDPDWWWIWKNSEFRQLGPRLLSCGYSTREALQALPKMLHHSSKTPELVSLLTSNLVFSSISFVFPKELHAARRAISRFLRPTVPLVNSRRISQ